MQKITRKSTGIYRDKYGRQSVRIGTRGATRVFMFNRSWSSEDVDKVKQQLKDVFDVCFGWNGLSNAIAESLKERTDLVPIPDIKLGFEIPIESKLIKGINAVREPMLNDRHLLWWESQFKKHLPGIPWGSLSESGVAQETLDKLKVSEMRSLQRAANNVAHIDNRPASTAKPVKGTLHDAMKKYDAYVRADQPMNHSRHSKIKQLIDRSTDVPLAMLDIEQCRLLIDYWRNRPPKHNGKGDYSAKRSREQLAELDQFFKHTHTSTDFTWRMPDDLQLLKRTVRKDDQTSLSYITIKLFSVEELHRLIQHGTLIEKLIVTWCLNCAQGAAEIGRATWGDLYLNQDHPWRSQGLKVEPGGNWTGFLRGKTDVVGWWHLWDETVQLLQEWKPEAERLLQRNVRDEDRIILTQDGVSMYKDKTSKNAQAKFADVFKNLRVKAGIEEGHTLGMIRKQLPDWITTVEGDETAASVALAHGIPHRADKLLFAHYSNRPWAKLFEHQRKYRDYLFPPDENITAVLNPT